MVALVVDGSACGWSDCCPGNHCCSTGFVFAVVCALTSSCILHCFVVVILH